MKGFEPKKLRYKDARGKWRVLYAAPLTQRETLRQTITEIVEYTKSVDQSLSFTQVYDDDDYFRHLVDEALVAGGVQPDWCTQDMLLCFLLPHQDNNGSWHNQGILLEVNFPQVAPESGSKSFTYAELLALLWGATDSLDQALKAAESVPHDLMLKVLEARSEALEEALSSPEERFKRQQQKLAKEDIQSNGIPLIAGEEVEVNLCQS